MKNKKEKQQGPSKSFMTSGPTLHYSHSNVLASFWFSFIVYAALCSFWAKINYGQVGIPDLNTLFEPDRWYLSTFLSTPLSIFEYRYQGLVIGGLVGLLSIVPLSVSLLLSFPHSILFILAAALIAQLPGLAVVLLVSCVAISCRPLRFRSRFISIVLCIVPSMLFWFLTGGLHTVEPLRWAYSYFPWMFAWIVALAYAGFALAVGHYTRYRPGTIGSLSLLFLLGNIFLFTYKVGFSEADYQIYVEVHNEQQSTVFAKKSITPILDEAVQDPVLKSYLTASFYSQDPIMLRSELKREIVDMLRWDHWPQWFSEIMPPEFNYQAARDRMDSDLDFFINKHKKSWRIPQVLYHKAMLAEMEPSLKILEMHEILEFDSSHANTEVIPIWGRLYRDFPESPESIEARCRIAYNLAAHKSLDSACELAQKALEMIKEHIKNLKDKPAELSGEIFLPIKKTAITDLKANDLQFRLEYLLNLISSNRSDDPAENATISEFISLNPNDIMYEKKLKSILAGLAEKNPLRDNVELAIILEIQDPYAQQEELEKFISENSGADSFIKARYKLARLKLDISRSIEDDEERATQLRRQALDVFKDIQKQSPDNIYNESIERILTAIKD
ncbi:hypothetical protein SMSP2_01193 [Limihaloglobus sulfuriphilus]|uniref:Uncharacterized protein n=1 Tax=Limihaloglobus sulfuriphilus TaxID=1851148 RepID=A0A1Q2MDQ7_9BACT|nr:hypothetical protein [Limihaloglobus sulfuriphilus]AQQ70831.1 hypothetical protein SMSP2_01193 [Limihaloglobus sulfuriphilus]